MKKLCLFTMLCAASGAFAASPTPNFDATKLPPPAQQPGVTFAKDIQPLLKQSCVRCHGAERPKAGLRLDGLEGVMQGTHDQKVVVPGDSQKSLLVVAVSQLDPKLAMPPKPRGPRPGGPGGTNNPAPGTSGGPAASGQNPPAGSPAPHPGGQGGQGGPPGPPAKPLTAEQVGLVRAWIDQGAK